MLHLAQLAESCHFYDVWERLLFDIESFLHEKVLRLHVLEHDRIFVKLLEDEDYLAEEGETLMLAQLPLLWKLEESGAVEPLVDYA